MPRKSNTPSISQWKQLYDLMCKLRELAPWEYMYEHNIFAIQFPENGRMGLVSVMGNLGEHYAISVYMDKKGFEGFSQIQKIGYELTPEILLQIPQLQASFEDREMITTADRKILKQLELKFRGKNAWPQFRSYRPGCFPWYLEKEEAQMLIHALEQLLDVAPRFREDPSLLETAEKEQSYLVRVQKDGTWEDQKSKVNFPIDPPLKIQMNMDALTELKGMRADNTILEVGLHMMEGAVKDDEFDRPFFPFILMVVEHASGMILGADILAPLPSIEEMWSNVPAQIVESLAGSFKPKEIQVKEPLLFQLLSLVGKETGIQIKQASRLPKLAQAMRELEQFQSLF
jgi:hypothetical protein